MGFYQQNAYIVRRTCQHAFDYDRKPANSDVVASRQSFDAQRRQCFQVSLPGRSRRISSVITLSTLFVLGLSAWTSGAAAAGIVNTVHFPYRSAFSALYLLCLSALDLVFIIVAMGFRENQRDFHPSRHFCQAKPCRRHDDLAAVDDVDDVEAKDNRVSDLRQRDRPLFGAFIRGLALARCDDRDAVGVVTSDGQPRQCRSTVCCRKDPVHHKIANCSRKFRWWNSDVVDAQRIDKSQLSPCVNSSALGRGCVTSVGIPRSGSVEWSPLPLLDMRPVLEMTSSLVAVTTARCRQPPPCACRCSGCSLVSLSSIVHSPDGSTERTLSPSSHRLRDFDDETSDC